MATEITFTVNGPLRTVRAAPLDAGSWPHRLAECEAFLTVLGDQTEMPPAVIFEVAHLDGE